MVVYLNTNNAASTIAVALTPSSTTIELAPGTGDRFPVTDPVLDPTGVFTMTLIDPSTAVREIVHVTERVGDVLTVIQRGQENTVPLAWPAGSRIEHLLTADQLNALWSFLTMTNVVISDPTNVDAKARVVTGNAPSDPALFGALMRYPELLDRLPNNLIATKNIVSDQDSPTTGILGVELGFFSVLTVQLLGTFVATLAFEGSADNGLTWHPVILYPVEGGHGDSVASAPSRWVAPAGGMTNFRVACTDYTSGTVAVAILGTRGLNLFDSPALSDQRNWNWDYQKLLPNPGTFVTLQTALGGRKGDLMNHAWAVPLLLDVGAINVKDGDGTAEEIYPARLLINDDPIPIPWRFNSKVGPISAEVGAGWKFVTFFGRYT